MTPTLLGRWQSRLFLLATVGVIVSLPFAFGLWGPGNGQVYFWVLLYVFVLGLGWDILYDFLQKFMWDHDWPGVFQFFACIAEAILLGLLIITVGLPKIPKELDLGWFAIHYSLVSVAAYLSSWMVLRLLFPRSRFRGGQWWGKWPQK